MAEREFVDVDLSGVRFVRSSLRGAVMRGVDIDGADIDAPWLLDGESVLLVNGVDVAPLVEAELNRRFPGRGQRRADDPEGLRSAWAVLEDAWAVALARAAALPPGWVDRSVDGEWSFSQTLRHLVMATDTWLLGAVQGVEQPYHPLGQPNAEFAADGHDATIFASGTPPYAEVLAVRTERMGMVREYLARVTPEDLEAPRANPWDPSHPETVRSCLHVILDEEWEHLRYALRDLDDLGRT